MRYLLLISLITAAASAQPLDVIIRGGKLVDGTGSPWRMADIGIRAGKIAEI